MKNAYALSFLFLIMLLTSCSSIEIKDKFSLALEIQVEPTHSLSGHVLHHLKDANQFWSMTDRINLGFVASRFRDVAKARFPNARLYQGHRHVDYPVLLKHTYADLNALADGADLAAHCLTVRTPFVETNRVCDSDLQKTIDMAFDEFIRADAKFLLIAENSEEQFDLIDLVAFENKKARLFTKAGSQQAFQALLVEVELANISEFLLSYILGEAGYPRGYLPSKPELRTDFLNRAVASPPASSQSRKLLLRFVRETREFRDEKWISVLNTAIKGGADSEVISAILSKRKDIQNFFIDGLSDSLVSAINAYRPDIVRMLLDLGAPVFGGSDDRLPALHQAAYVAGFFNDLAIIDMLIEQGEALNVNDHRFGLPLAYALEGHFKSKRGEAGTLVEEFIRRDSPVEMKEVAKSDGTRVPASPLYVASQRGLSGAVEVLLAQGSSVDGQYRKDVYVSPLFNSLLHDQIIVAKMLIKHGANVNFQNSQGRSVLMLAVEKKEAELLELLLNNTQIELNATDNEGRTALFFAYPDPESVLSDQNRHIVDRLLAAGLDESIRDNAGRTAETRYQSEREKVLERQYTQQRKQQLEDQARFSASSDAGIGQDRGEFDWFKAAALGVGFVAGGGLELDSETQTRVLKGIVNDSRSSIAGAPSTTGALSNGQEFPDNSATGASRSVNARKHYAVMLGKTELRTCDHEDVQANSFCRTANTYYKAYLNSVQDNLPNSSKLYAVHKQTVRLLMDFLKNSSGGGVYSAQTGAVEEGQSRDGTDQFRPRGSDYRCDRSGPGSCAIER